MLGRFYSEVAYLFGLLNALTCLLPRVTISYVNCQAVRFVSLELINIVILADLS